MNNKYLRFGIVAFLFLLLPLTVQAGFLDWITGIFSSQDTPSFNADYIIDGNSVYVDTQDYFINVTPHTRIGPGYVYIDFMSKDYQGKVRFVMGTDDTKVDMKGLEYYNPHTYEVMHEYVCDEYYNVGSFYFTCYSMTNGTVLYEGVFDEYIPGQDKFVWYEQVSKDYLPIGLNPNRIRHGFDEKNYWRNTKDTFTVQKDVIYKLRIKINPPNYLHANMLYRLHKYDFAFYPHNYQDDIESAISAGEFYMIDPWTEGTNSVISYYTFDGNMTTATNATDSSGFQNGTLKGPDPNQTGIVNDSYDFVKASLDHIITQNFSIGTTDEMTWNIWINPDNAQAQWLLRHGDYTSFSNGRRIVMFGFTASNNIRAMVFNCVGDSRYVDHTYTPPTGTWTMLTMVVNMSSALDVYLYINGTNITSPTTRTGGYTSGNICPNSHALNIGRFRSDATRYFDGYLDEIGYWNRSLSSDEIEYLYNNSAPTMYQQYPFPTPGANVAPNVTVPLLNVSGATIINGTDLVANTTYTDSNGDTGSVWWTLYVNGTANQTYTNTSVASGTLLWATFPAANYGNTDNLTVEALPDDLTVNGTPRNSTVIDVVLGNVAPVMQSCTILPAVAYANDTLEGYANATDGNADRLVYNFTWYLNASYNSNGSYPTCYQENANGAHANDGNCTLNYNGSYYQNGYVYASNIYDGDWTTWAFKAATPYYVFVNYTKPNQTVSDLVPSIFQINQRNAPDTTFNFSIPINCTNQSFLQMYYHGKYVGSYVFDLYCFDGVGNYTFVSNHADASGYFYEEAVIWTLDYEQGVEVNVNNISSDYLVHFDNWTLECSALENGTGLNTGYLNSTVLEIQNTPPVFNQSLTDQTVHHNENLSYQVNCSDPVDGDSIIYSVNDSLVTINSSTGLIFDDPAFDAAGVYDILVSCNDSYNVTSEQFNYTILNDFPEITTPVLSPATIYGWTNLTASTNYSDNETDTGIIWWTLFVNGVANQTGSNTSVANGTTVLFTFSAANYAEEDNLTVEAMPDDAYQNGTALNSSTIQVSNGTNVTTQQVSPVFETTRNQFNLTYLNIYGDVNSSFLYNNSFYTPTKDTSGDEYTFLVNVSAPLVSINLTNISWRWVTNYTDELSGVSQRNDSGTQGVLQAFLPSSFAIYANDTVETQHERYHLIIHNYTNSSNLVGIVQRNLTNYTSGTFTNFASNQAIQNRTLNTNLQNVLVDNHTWNAWLNVTFGGVTMTRNFTDEYNSSSHQFLLETCPGTITNTTGINFSFVSADTGLPVNLSSGSGVSIEVWNRTSTQVRNYSFYTNNYTNYSICMYPDFATLYMDYDLLADADGYNQLNLFTSNQLFTNTSPHLRTVSLTNQSNTTLITIRVQDQNTQPYPDYVVYAWLYDPVSGNYSLLSSDITDFTGRVGFYLDIVDTYYKFNVTDNFNNLVYSTGFFQITQSEYTFTINRVETPIVANTMNLSGLNYSLTYNVTSPYFVNFTWNDANSITNQVCLRIRNLSGMNAFTDLSTVCSTNQAGSISYLVSNGSHIMAIALANFTGDNLLYTLDSLEVDRTGFSNIFGIEGVFWQMILTGTLMIIGFIAAGIAGGFIFTALSLALGQMIGLINLGWTTIIAFGLITIFVIIAKGRNT